MAKSYEELEFTDNFMFVNITKRSRYYHSVMDMEILLKGSLASKLKEQ